MGLAEWAERGEALLVYGKLVESLMQVDSETDVNAEVLDSEMFGGAAGAYAFIRSVLEASTEYSIIATDLQGVILLWNEGARRSYGYESGEIIGRHESILHTDRDVVGGLPGLMMGGASEHGKWEGTVERVRKDGSGFTARVVMTLRCSGEGKPIGFLLMSSDITDELRLAAERTRLQYTWSVLESAPDAIVIVNRDGVVQLANAATETLFGYRREELVGRPVEMLMPERYRGRHDGHRAGFFSNPRARGMSPDLVLSGRRKDGVEFPVEISLSPLETEDGVFATAAIRDVSERVRVERLALALKYKSEFLANMSHELRTPLNSVLILAGILQENSEQNLTAKQVQYASVIHASGTDLHRLLNDILDLAEVESGTVMPEISELALGEIQETLEREFRHVADDRRVPFAIALADGLPSHIATDSARLRQVLHNLLENAFKFTERGAVSMRISCAESGWSATNQNLARAEAVIAFSITDTGIGITTDVQQRIFEPFIQGDGSTARRYGGTGLGLSVSRELVGLLGGEITLTSTLNQGSTFTVYLPTRSPNTTPRPLVTPNATVPQPSSRPAPDAPVPQPTPRRPASAETKALIIDDDPRNIFALTALLKRAGFAVVSSESGEAGIAMLEHAPDIEIALVDIMMPVMDGYATIGAIRKLPSHRHLPILAVTAKVGADEAQRCIDAGASTYIPKPVDTANLMHVISQWLPAGPPTRN